MSGWSVLICSVICAAGMLAFLSVVANALERCGQRLRLLEQEERRAQRQRQGEVIVEAEATTRVA